MELNYKHFPVFEAPLLETYALRPILLSEWRRQTVGHILFAWYLATCPA